MYTLGTKVVCFINCQWAIATYLPYIRTRILPWHYCWFRFFSIPHFKSCCNARPPCVGWLAFQEGTACKVPAIQAPCHIVKVILCENLRRFFFVSWFGRLLTSQTFFLLRKEPRVQLNFLDACLPECRKKFLLVRRCSPPGVAPSSRVQQDNFIF